MSRKSAYILAATFGWDTSEVRECEYQPGHTGKDRIYSIGNDYWHVGQHPPKWGIDGIVPLKWTRHSDQFWAEKYNTIVWKSSIIINP